MKFLPTFYDAFDNLFHDPFMNYSSVDAMRTDIVEQDGHYLLNMELPGYKKEDIQMELDNGYLKINATKNVDNEEKDSQGRVVRRERYSGSCSRNFFVGEGVRQEDIRASFENGELKVSIPKDNIQRVEEKKYISID